MKKALSFLVLLAAAAMFVSAGAQKEAAKPEKAAGPVKLSYWEALGRAASGHKSLATHPGWIELQKRMGVEISFLTPAVGNETEQFNLMVASRNLPDIITHIWMSVPGGPAGYIKDGVIIKLNEHIEKGAPDLLNAFKKFPTAKREAMLDDGSFYVFPQIYSDPALAHWYGPMLRRDLLNKVPGVDASKFPSNMETLDEWEKVLTAVKNSGLKGASGRDIIPLSLLINADHHNGSFIVGAWGIGTRFTNENGTPVYGPADPRYLEYLKLMKRWYDQGLLDKEFAANNAKMMDEKMLDNRVFATSLAMGGGVTRYTGLARPKNPDFLMNIVKYPVIKKGDQPLLGFRTGDYTGTGAAITTACKNVEAAVKLLNYDYSEEGYVLANFGLEGKTFNRVNGYPKYTDLIMNNPDKFSRDIATGCLVRVGNHVGIKSLEFLEQRDSLPEQLGPNGRALWMATSNKVKLPLVSPTAAESSEFGRIMNEVNTYADEMTVKFIMGVEPLEKYGEYVQTLKRLKVDRALEIMRDQISRYFKRP